MKPQIYTVLFLALSLCACAQEPEIAATSIPPIQTTVSVQPTTSVPAATATPTQPPQPSTPPATTLPPSTETEAYIGTLYTREHLESLDNTLRGYGCGRNYNTDRPDAPVNCQKESGGFHAAFIAEDIPTVYLTFDCGYEFNNLTADILDTLKEKNIKAVFFVTMYYCKTQPQLVQRMIDEGHTVGNHSNNHPSMPTLSLDDMVYEIMSLHEYVKTNFGYEMTLFRPPKGEYSARSLAVAQTLGYKSVFWSFAYQDWITDAQPDPAKALTTVTGCAHNGCIYLLHAVSATNAAILGDVIDNLQSRGYSLELFQ